MVIVLVTREEFQKKVAERKAKQAESRAAARKETQRRQAARAATAPTSSSRPSRRSSSRSSSRAPVPMKTLSTGVQVVDFEKAKELGLTTTTRIIEDKDKGASIKTISKGKDITIERTAPSGKKETRTLQADRIVSADKLSRAQIERLAPKSKEEEAQQKNLILQRKEVELQIQDLAAKDPFLRDDKRIETLTAKKEALDKQLDAKPDFPIVTTSIIPGDVTPGVGILPEDVVVGKFKPAELPPSVLQRAEDVFKEDKVSGITRRLSSTRERLTSEARTEENPIKAAAKTIAGGIAGTGAFLVSGGKAVVEDVSSVMMLPFNILRDTIAAATNKPEMSSGTVEGINFLLANPKLAATKTVENIQRKFIEEPDSALGAAVAEVALAGTLGQTLDTGIGNVFKNVPKTKRIKGDVKVSGISVRKGTTTGQDLLTEVVTPKAKVKLEFEEVRRGGQTPVKSTVDIEPSGKITKTQIVEDKIIVTTQQPGQSFSKTDVFDVSGKKIKDTVENPSLRGKELGFEEIVKSEPIKASPKTDELKLVDIQQQERLLGADQKISKKQRLTGEILEKQRLATKAEIIEPGVITRKEIQDITAITPEGVKKTQVVTEKGKLIPDTRIVPATSKQPGSIDILRTDQVTKVPEVKFTEEGIIKKTGVDLTVRKPAVVETKFEAEVALEGILRPEELSLKEKQLFPTKKAQLDLEPSLKITDLETTKIGLPEQKVTDIAIPIKALEPTAKLSQDVLSASLVASKALKLGDITEQTSVLQSLEQVLDPKEEDQLADVLSQQQATLPDEAVFEILDLDSLTKQKALPVTELMQKQQTAPIQGVTAGLSFFPIKMGVLGGGLGGMFSTPGESPLKTKIRGIRTAKQNRFIRNFFFASGPEANGKLSGGFDASKLSKKINNMI